jgi:ribonucleoside-triphosphate reductase
MVHGRHVEISSRVKHLAGPTSLAAAAGDAGGA